MSRIEKDTQERMIIRMVCSAELTHAATLNLISLLCSYNICEDFADDARLMFSNCETFNEPNSPVGKAGRKLRLFFEKRYTEILDNS